MLDIRRRMMMDLIPQDIIIDARNGDANAVSLMEVIYEDGWSRSLDNMMNFQKQEKVGKACTGLMFI